MAETKDNQDSHQPILRTERLSRFAGDARLVEDVNLEVRCCEVVSIVGPSGSGKSSLLRLLNRLDEPTGGTVYFRGQDYRTIPPRELRRRIGLVMQAPNLFPGSVGDNLRFGPEQHGESMTVEKIEDLLAGVGLSGWADRNVEGLSGGEAQRVSLARTLANSPEILLLDEPTSALDDAAEREVEELIMDVIRQHKLTCLIVTHDKAQAVRLSTAAVLLEKGRLVKAGPTGEVIDA
jgi:putative ABC transport system ATP-binding protein